MSKMSSLIEVVANSDSDKSPYPGILAITNCPPIYNSVEEVCLESLRHRRDAR